MVNNPPYQQLRQLLVASATKDIGAWLRVMVSEDWTEGNEVFQGLVEMVADHALETIWQEVEKRLRVEGMLACALADHEGWKQEAMGYFVKTAENELLGDS